MSRGSPTVTTTTATIIITSFQTELLLNTDRGRPTVWIQGAPRKAVEAEVVMAEAEVVGIEAPPGALAG